MTWSGWVARPLLCSEYKSPSSTSSGEEEGEPSGGAPFPGCHPHAEKTPSFRREGGEDPNLVLGGGRHVSPKRGEGPRYLGKLHPTLGGAHVTKG